MSCVVFLCGMIQIIHQACSALQYQKKNIYFKGGLNGTYISSHHKGHKALTFSFRPLRFAARALRVAHDCHPTVCLSSSITLPHVVSGQHGLLKRYET